MKATQKRTTVEHPPHYQAANDPAGVYECINVIEAWEADFCIGNVLKYLSRAGKKGSELEDLKKAQWYLQRAIEQRAKRG